MRVTKLHMGQGGRWWRPRTVALALAVALPAVQGCGLLDGRTATEESNSGSDPAVGPAVSLIMTIFVRAGLQVAKRSIQRAFTAEAAEKAVGFLSSGKNLEKLRGSVCYSLHVSRKLRIILDPTKTTVLFAGSHEAYNTFYNEKVFNSICR